jgi:hypothetical protein
MAGYVVALTVNRTVGIGALATACRSRSASSLPLRPADPARPPTGDGAATTPRSPAAPSMPQPFHLHDDDIIVGCETA